MISSKDINSNRQKGSRYGSGRTFNNSKRNMNHNISKYNAMR